MKKNKVEILKYVNENLKGYVGYIQLMGAKIDEAHVFLDNKQAPSLKDNELIYEAHFYSGEAKKSVLIRQINDGWFVDETDLSCINLSKDDERDFYAKDGTKIKMAQIWQEQNDEFCENLPVLKIQKSVFTGFAKDEKDEK